MQHQNEKVSTTPLWPFNRHGLLLYSRTQKFRFVLAIDFFGCRSNSESDAGLGFARTCGNEQPDPGSGINLIANLTRFFANETTIDEIEKVEADIMIHEECQAEKPRKGEFFL